MSDLRILVACEFSGIVRRAFANRGGGGRISGLSIYTTTLGRDATTGARLDHPRLNGRLLLKDALLHSERAHCVSSDLHRLEPVVCHRARPQSGLVEYVALGFWPFLQILDRVSHAGDLAHQVLTFLQIDRFVEGSSVHLSLSIVERFQQLGSRYETADRDLRSLLDRFKGAVFASTEEPL